MLTNEVTKENLNKLVVSFYTRVLKDDLIGPIFKDVLGEDMKGDKWQAHIELLTNFWASIALGDFTYNGNPFAPHVQFQDKLSIKAFEQWMKLFFVTLNTIYEPQIAQQFLARSKNIAGNFIRNLQLS
ncbi:group III truncated hemoglobin [Sulfurimonas sp.]|jgi:hemoglobin|uniref:group III truncated hemoglobin n=1 Tax=Sulfurimonas sp. TaxID=2022749 RepID=UPI0025E9042E|nr:group III truncated hemoglobin [Sulfurimonas sp.]MBT5935733.1 group III truncated hemoglobin [Sulfurimonas sp.]